MPVQVKVIHNEIVYTSLDSTSFQKLKDQGENAGFNVSGDQGTIHASGISADYSYLPDHQQLTITVKSKPFFLSMDLITKSITDRLTPFFGLA